MTQQRFHVSTKPDFKSALQEKEAMLATNPHLVLQIRKRKQGQQFELVRRVPLAEVLLNPDKIIKSRRKRGGQGKGQQVAHDQNNQL